MKDFMLELGRDLCFVCSEYPLQVSTRDFALDLLFFHRGLNCLVAMELKVTRFEPEYLGKLSFYLEALDRDVRRRMNSPPTALYCAPAKSIRCSKPHTVSGADRPVLRAASRQETAPRQAQ